MLHNLRSCVRILLGLVLIAGCGLSAAASSDEILKEARATVPEEAWLDLGSDAWARAIETALARHQDLAASEQQKLQLALAEAWLAAGNLNEADKPLQMLAAVEELPAALRERYGNALILRWTLQWRNSDKPQAVVPAPKMLQQAGSFAKDIRARAHVAEAARLIALDKARKSLIQYDAAYALMKDADLQQRITILQLRLTAMEGAGLRQTAIADWFDRRKKDEAVKAMAAGMFSEAVSMLGKTVPVETIQCKDMLGDDVEIELRKINKPARLIFVFATWSRGSHESAAVLARFVSDHADQVDLVGISLDAEESIKDIPAFVQRYGLSMPVMENPKSWESAIAKELAIEALPTIIMLDKQAVVLAIDIHGADAEATGQRLLDSLKDVLDGPAPAHNDDVETNEDAEDFVP